MKAVGLTGGIGAGKSTVSARLAARGAVVVDADAIVREQQRPGTPVFAAIVERFGAGVVAADGTLDRPALAGVVFGDPDALAALNAITHPAVGAEILRRLGELAGTASVAVLDVPLLVRAGRPAERRYPVAGVLVVDCPVEEAVRRLVTARGMTEADARARVASQVSREERLAAADFVIDNGGPPEALEEQVAAAWEWIGGLPEG